MTAKATKTADTANPTRSRNDLGGDITALFNSEYPNRLAVFDQRGDVVSLSTAELTNLVQFAKTHGVLEEEID